MIQPQSPKPVAVSRGKSPPVQVAALSREVGRLKDDLAKALKDDSFSDKQARVTVDPEGLETEYGPVTISEAIEKSYETLSTPQLSGDSPGSATGD